MWRNTFVLFCFRRKLFQFKLKQFFPSGLFFYFFLFVIQTTESFDHLAMFFLGILMQSNCCLVGFFNIKFLFVHHFWEPGSCLAEKWRLGHYSSFCWWVELLLPLLSGREPVCSRFSCSCFPIHLWIAEYSQLQVKERGMNAHCFLC